jgi:restriction endonuclease S subunit
MKSSDIDRLGDFPSVWKVSKIKYNAKINPPSYSKGLSRDAEVAFLPMEYIHNGYYEQNTVSLEELQDSYNTFNNNDIIIAKVSPCFENGNIAIVRNLVNDFGFGTSEIFVIRANKNFSNTYLMYLLQNRIFIEQAISYMTGVAGLKRISSSFIENYTFGSPPLPEQNAIATFLDEKCGVINSIIKDMNEQIEILNQYKKTVITETITKGLDKNAPMKDSGIEWIGKIPTHWKVSKIKYKAKINPPSYSKGLNKDAEVTFLPMEYIHNGYYEQNTTSLEELNTSYNTFNNGDLIIAKVTPCFENGNIAIVKNLINDFGFGTSEIFVIRTDKDFSNLYLMYLLQNRVFIDQAVVNMTGVAGLKRVPSSFVENYTFGSPPFFEQNAIADFLDSKCAEIDKLISEKHESIKTMQDYKKSLIYEYTTGKKRVKGETY